MDQLSHCIGSRRTRTAVKFLFSVEQPFSKCRWHNMSVWQVMCGTQLVFMYGTDWPISCQLVAEHRVRPTTCSVAFSPATFNFLRHRTFLKAGLKEGREMQLLVNRDSLQLQNYPGSRNHSSQACWRCVCVCVSVRVCVCLTWCESLWRCH